MNLIKFYLKFSKDHISKQLGYVLNDSEIAYKWFQKIKHLKHIPVDRVESEIMDLSDLDTIYRHFCEFANIEYKKIDSITQPTLNQLHQCYEKLHAKLSVKKNNQILYKFHHAIHSHEAKPTKRKHLHIGWGSNEGPLTTNFKCNIFYEDKLKKNHIYLPWSELGKTPLHYWRNQEPNNIIRFVELAKPHQTFRARFKVSLEDYDPNALPNEFIHWFAQYKESWLSTYELDDWTEIDEYSAPLLAIPTHNQNMQQMINQGYIFDCILC